MLAAKSSVATPQYYSATARATNPRVLNVGEMKDALPDLAPYGELTADKLTRDVTLLQRKKGHRFSSDDVITAYVAYHAAPTAATVCWCSRATFPPWQQRSIGCWMIQPCVSRRAT